jgi:mRNA-degrading endonuclease RelE of RelBE toxin-antitoxin system
VIRVRLLRSFEDDLNSLPDKDAAKARAAVERLTEYFDGGPRPLGLGLRKLKGEYWEIRAGLNNRVLFSLSGDLATFVLVGNHDEIRRRLHA